jgi:integrase
MGQQKKNSKGTVSIVNADGRIRLRWRYQCKRYSINIAYYNKENLTKAKQIAYFIERDLLSGSFDYTLIKYKNPSTISVEDSLVNLYEKWLTTYKNKNCSRDKHYHSVRNMLIRWGNIQPIQIVDKLNHENLGAHTYNRRLRMLSEFVDFLVLTGMVQSNLLKAVHQRKAVKPASTSRKPFTEDEIKRILQAFREDTFSPHILKYRHSHYYPFVYFIFKTGVRNAEAVGLRVESINPGTKHIVIKEVLARTVKGTNAAARIRKETKNGKQRLLPLTEDLEEILLPLVLGRKTDDLVFTSPAGKAIDDRMFQRRVFSKVLKGLNIEHRHLYACRHTFNSRCIEAGMTPVMAAFLMGNNPETALRNYTHQLSLPEHLPKIT